MYNIIQYWQILSKINGYCSTLSITAQFCLMFSNIVISLDFFQILINIVKYSQNWLKESCIANTSHGCFIVILYCFNKDLRGIITVVSYCFQLILAFLGCFIGVSRLFCLGLFQVCYICFWSVFQGYFIECFSYVLRGLQGWFMPVNKVYGCFMGKLKDFFGVA